MDLMTVVGTGLSVSVLLLPIATGVGPDKVDF
jgi:hypothetical protein